MKELIHRYKLHFRDKQFLLSLLLGIAFLLTSFVINFYAGTFATIHASNSVNDIVLSNTPAVDFDDIFIYGPVVMWFFVTTLCIFDPRKIPFVLKSISLFVIVRSIFVTLTHIGPYPDHISISNDPEQWINNFAFGGDLFFSAHTGLPFLMALIFGKNLFLRIIFTITAIFFGVVVLLAHLHYSIDVLSAFFITFTIFSIAKTVFKNDWKVFLENDFNLNISI